MVKILSDIQFSGSRGSITFGHNKGGQYQRARSVPTNPNSNRQQAVRTILANQAVGWYGLTAAQRASWEAYASTNPVIDSLGQSIYLTGMAWYIKCNARLADAGGTLVSAPPVLPAPTGLLTLTVAWASASSLTVTFTGALSATTRLQLWQTIPGSSAKSPNFKQARLVGYSTLNQASPWTATAMFLANIGDAATFYAAVLNTEGMISAYRQASATRAA